MAKSVTLILKDVTLSYPHLDKPQEPQNPNDKAKYSGAFVLTTAQVEEIKKAALEVATEKWGTTKGPTMVTVGGNGSMIRNDIAGKYNIPGAVAYISARNENQPGLVYRHVDPSSISEARPKGVAAKVEKEKIKEVFYPGAKVNASITLYAYEKPTKKGVGFALNHVQKWADAPRIDGRASVEDTFDAEMSEAPASLEGLV